MKKTAYAAACEVSRDLGLSLSNGQAHDLADFLNGFHDQEEAQNSLYAKGAPEVRKIVRKLRSA